MRRVEWRIGVHSTRRNEAHGGRGSAGRECLRPGVSTHRAITLLHTRSLARQKQDGRVRVFFFFRFLS